MQPRKIRITDIERLRRTLENVARPRRAEEPIPEPRVRRR
jgi:hypothetical protein